MTTLQEPLVAPFEAAVRPPPARPALRAREIALLALGGVVLAVVMTWPVAAHIGSRVAGDLGDPIRTAWQVAWEGHALTLSSGGLWDANAFWPLHTSLAFSDSLLGYAPAGLVGSGGVGVAVARYDVLFLFTYALAFVGAALLARELGASRTAAAVAGVAFAYAPFRATMDGHLHVLSSGGIPLSLFLLVRGYRRRSAWLVLAGWLVVAWQLTLGFTLGLQLAYLLAVLAGVAAVLWWRRGRPAPGTGVIVVTVAGVLVAAAATVYQARPYLRVHRDYPSARRTTYDVGLYSSNPSALLAAPAESRVWGAATASVRNGLRSRNEDTLFPGLAILGLAVVGAGWARWPRPLRIGLVAGVVACAVLSLGFGLPPYHLLYDLAPGWNAVRTPGRIVTLTALGLALLAAAGADVVLGAATRRWRRVGAVAAGVLLVVVVLADGAGRVGDPRVPLPPPGHAALAQPQLQLPTNSSYDRLYQLWSTDGFPAIVNGVSTFDLPGLDSVRGVMRTFPDAQSVLFLRQHGIRTVVLHTRLGVGLPPAVRSPALPRNPAAAAAKPVRGLLLRRRTIPGAVVYTVLRVHHIQGP
ncbi:MAG TPA: hypothetical protein VHR88_09220 [Solirubrobacteraceae bacterium]|nr:hypothetical protein [Solirubrobacteraceae bacterium]